jgi:transposase
MSDSKNPKSERSLDARDERIRELEKINAEQAAKLKEREEQIKQLESLLAAKVETKSSKKPHFPENYSVDRNVKPNPNPNNNASGKRPGRKPNSTKAPNACDTILVFPEGIAARQCVHHRFQYAWRIIDGKATYVCYDIRALPDSSDLPLPPGLRTSRSEYGIEIILTLSFLHFWVGVSLDNACQIINFFTELDLPKSQADSLLNQLSSDWEQQYDTIAQLIALQMIVYIDETGWRVGKKSCYTWVFSTSMHVLFRCGVSRKKAEATAVLGDSFEGIGVTDDYAAYQSMFSEHQLCWAHLLRKAIKLMLKNSDQPEYKTFLDQLCQIYHDAKDLREAALAGEQEGNDFARQPEIEKLQQRIITLCDRREEKIITAKAAAKCDPPVEQTPDSVADFIRLQRELADNAKCLFVFVNHPEVEPTNNRSERNVRREAEIRKGARTSKTARGAKRRSIIVTVLASLQTRISGFSLSKVLYEIDRWIANGASLFEQELTQEKANPPPDAQTAPSL